MTDDLGPTFYRVLTASTGEELWPDADRRDVALSTLLAACNVWPTKERCPFCGRFTGGEVCPHGL